jgi:chemotaxis protein histidine kinase CheA
VLDCTIKESSAITPANRSLPISQFAAEDTQERLDGINHNVVDGPDLIKTPPRSSTRVNGTPNREHGRSDKVSEAEKHEPVAQSRGIRDPYSDIETDLEEPSSIMKRRGGVTRLYGKTPSGTPRWNLRNGNVPVKNRTGTTQKSSSPSAAINPIPRNSLLTAKKANGLVNGTSGASSKLDEDMRDESPDAGAEEAAKELSRLTADAVAQRRLQVEREKIRKDETERKAAEGAKRELKRINKAEAEKKAADLARQEQEQRAAEDERRKTAEIARKEEEEQKAAENERKKAAEIARKEEEKQKAADLARQEEEQRAAEDERKKAAKIARKEEEKEKAAKIKADAQKAKAAEAKAREEETTRKQAEAIAKRDAEAKEQAERVRKQTAEANERLAADKAEEAAKAVRAAQDKKIAEEASARKKSTPTRSPGGMLGRAVAAYSPDKSTVNHETNGSDMPPPALHERPGSSRRRSSDIQMTSPSDRGSVDIGVEGHKLLAKAGRRVSWAEATPSQSGKVPGKIVEARQKASPSVVQTRVSPSVRTPATVNGIRTSKSGSAQGKIQSTIVPVSVRATTVKGKAITPSSSQAPTPTQKTIITATPGSKESLRAALLGTITKASGRRKSDSLYSGRS